MRIHWVLLSLIMLARPGASAVFNLTANNFFFSSRTITVMVGDTVQWSGLGSGHNVAQSNGPADTAYNGTGALYSGSPLNGIPSYQFTFNSAGDYWYVCDFHAGTDMKGLVIVQAPSPTPTPSATPTPTSTDSPTPTASPSASPSFTATDSPTVTETPNPAFSPTDSPTQTQTSTASPTFTDSPSPTATPSASPSHTPSPTHSVSPTISPTQAGLQSPTQTPGVSFAGVESAGLLASPISGGVLRYWANLTGAAQGAELRVYSGAFTLLSVHDLGPQQAGHARWTLALPRLPAQAVWLQLRVQQDGRWRNGPVLRSYVLP